MDYVWDYGTLAVADEKSYIASIVNTTFPKAKPDVITLMVEAIYTSQHCIAFLILFILNILHLS
jgi:hypothetical protein